MKARVTVTLKSGVLDPQGKAIGGALGSLGVDGVTSVRQGKIFDLEFDAADEAAANVLLRRACERLLANTVIENYRVDIERETAAHGHDVAQDEPAASVSDADRAAQDAADDAEMPIEGHP